MTGERRDGHHSGVPYRPGIDGLRAIAVVAVILYHADVSWLPAGFLGVDVFFVISGYLICSLLLAEWDTRGAVGLARFWMRRARRLLPALVALLVGVTAAALVLAPDAVTRLRSDLPAACAYVSNWWQIWRGESYFEAFGRAPLLRHLWSLAVEEQFYVVFPLVFVAVARTARRHRRAVLALLALTGAAASAIAMAAWYPAGRDPSRVYYGTDTRATGLCIGVVLACLLPLARRQSTTGRARALALDVTAVCGLVALGVAMARLNDYTPSVFRGGFAWASLAAAVTLAAIAHPASRVGGLLGRQPLRWIGTRSYAIYLWHWPLFMLTRPRSDLALGRWPDLALQLGLTGLLAEASWRLVEQRFRRPNHRPVPAPVRRRRRRAGLVIATGVALILGAGLVDARQPAVPSYLSASTVSATHPLAITPGDPARTQPGAPATSLPATTTVTDAASSVTTTLVTQPAAPGPASSPAPAAADATPPPTTPPPPPPGAVLAVGDSVMVAASRALVAQSGGKVQVDAVVGRQVDEGLAVLQQARDSGRLNDLTAVVVHLGTNGPMTAKQFDRLAAIVAGVPRVVVVNVRVPKRWEGESNTSISHGAAAHPEMRLADWYQASGAPHVLGSDGVHPTPSGAKVYSQVVLAQLAGVTPPPPPPTTTTTAPPPPPPPPPPSTEPSTTTSTVATTTTTSAPATSTTPTTGAPG